MLLMYLHLFFSTQKKNYRQSGSRASSKYDGMTVVCKITVTQIKFA